MANVLILTGATERTEGDLPRILWDNELTSATVAASSTDASSSTAYLTDNRLDRAWTAASGTSHTLTWTFSADTTVSALAIHGHNIGNLPSGAVSIEAWLAGASDWSTVIGSTAITGTRTFYRYFTSIVVEKIRVSITHTGTTMPSVAAVSAGLDVECERGLQAGWADPLLGRSPSVTPARSRNGIPLPGTITDATLDQEFKLENVSFTWASDYWLPFLRFCGGSRAPFFLSWAPQTYPDRACYCSGAEFTDVAFSQKGMCNVSFRSRMDIETGWVQI